jgi:hypothetical protein
MEISTMLRSLARVLPLLLLAMLGGEAHAGDAEIRALWSELDAAWNARDVERFSALYADDASLLFIDGGKSLEGRVTIHANFSEQFARTPPGLSHHTTLGGIGPVATGSRSPMVQSRYTAPSRGRRTRQSWYDALPSSR